MTHRGGINADGKTGDGCGLLMQKPDAFLRAKALEHFNAELPAQYAVGMVFLDQDASKADRARAQLSEEIQAQGLTLVGWREVPVDTSVLGQLALERLPRIEQVFVSGDGLDERQFGIKLFFARRRAEVALADDSSFYVCSLSDKDIIYKGLMMPADLAQFYPDGASRPRSACSTSVSPPTPCRSGGWQLFRLRTTAKSTPSPVTALGPGAPPEVRQRIAAGSRKPVAADQPHRF